MDISGYGLFRWNMLRYGVDVCGAEKIIFGSDMPTCSAGMYLYGALSENMTDEEFRLILGGNFRRLLGSKK
jgi:predicted TIM-barrel fold metal-dependent hydrolase